MYKTSLAALLITTTMLVTACSDRSIAPESTATPPTSVETTTPVPTATSVSQSSPTSTTTPVSSPTFTPLPSTDLRTVIEEYDVSVFIGSIRRTNLAEQWVDQTPITLLAPNNSAYKALPYATYLSLRNDLATLTEVTMYHVILGEFTVEDLMTVDSVQTLLGQELEVEVQGEEVTIGGAKILTPDIISSLGRLHVIDLVLIP